MTDGDSTTKLPVRKGRNTKKHGNGMVLFLLSFSRLPLSLIALSIDVSSDVKLRFSSLVGGPSWLPIHCQVIVYDAFRFDFVPINPTSSETLQRLVTLQAVPGEVRRLNSRSLTECDRGPLVLKAEEFCIQYNRDLHLIRNNCWSFSYGVVKFLLDDE